MNEAIYISMILKIIEQKGTLFKRVNRKGNKNGRVLSEILYRGIINLRRE
jgi:hypothetical protein